VPPTGGAATGTPPAAGPAPADPKSKVYGAALPTLSYTASGFVNGETAATALTGALATTATASSDVGSYPITQGTLAAVNYTISFTGNTLTVTPAATTTTASGPAGSVTQGQPVSLTATVTSAAGTPSGTVNFLEGTTVVATGTLSGGTLTTSTSTLSVGSHTLFARYVGSGN